MAGVRFRNVSNHVQDISTGATVGPGEYVTLNEDQIDHPHNTRLIAEGDLLEAPTPKQEERLKQEGGKK